jgi:hypothetical protein
LRTVVTREPEWDADERAWMLGLAMREAAECHRCGGDLTETLDWNYRWDPQPPSVCLRCVALQASEQAHEKHPNHRAMIHQVAKRVRPQPKKRRR